MITARTAEFGFWFFLISMLTSAYFVANHPIALVPMYASLAGLLICLPRK